MPCTLCARKNPVRCPKGKCTGNRKNAILCVRDITERQRAREFIRWQWENFVMPAARHYALPSRRYADMVINATADLDSVVKMFADAVQQKHARAASR